MAIRCSVYECFISLMIKCWASHFCGSSRARIAAVQKTAIQITERGRLMKLTRREFSKGCALAASSLAIGETAQVWAQVQGEHIGTSQAHPVHSVQDTESRAQKDARLKWFREA